ncbi:hypothetical protein L3Q82_025171 [Scortum barcoo]|uniref:Uncharacterized protein n=1 Tax=Scortum barcoo TaxID=214431 RepID=A0ACB8WQX1_9TELE|nr:hypothetical protein L3Q82_025171 [Scortum barcoo]
MKVVGSTCALKSKVGGEDVVRCLSDQSLTISKCKIPLLDEQMAVFLQDMNSCYSKLKELVPTLPTNKKASKVEILQHVIDYIWDLQVELDEPEKSRQLSGSSVTRTPLTTLNAELASITVEVNIFSHVLQNKPETDAQTTGLCAVKSPWSIAPPPHSEHREDRTRLPDVTTSIKKNLELCRDVSNSQC